MGSDPESDGSDYDSISLAERAGLADVGDKSDRDPVRTISRIISDRFRVGAAMTGVGRALGAFGINA